MRLRLMVHKGQHLSKWFSPCHPCIVYFFMLNCHPCKLNTWCVENESTIYIETLQDLFCCHYMVKVPRWSPCPLSEIGEPRKGILEVPCFRVLIAFRSPGLIRLTLRGPICTWRGKGRTMYETWTSDKASKKCHSEENRPINDICWCRVMWIIWQHSSYIPHTPIWQVQYTVLGI